MILFMTEKNGSIYDIINFGVAMDEGKKTYEGWLKPYRQPLFGPDPKSIYRME